MYSPAKETTDSLKDKKMHRRNAPGLYHQRRYTARHRGKKGSITAGKDADFLVFENDLLTAEHEGFSYNMPCGVYFSVKKMN
jgi:predicted amidohydrolase YtcJ